MKPQENGYVRGVQQPVAGPTASQALKSAAAVVGVVVVVLTLLVLGVYAVVSVDLMPLIR